MRVNKTISNKVAEDILSERLMGASINRVSYFVSGWTFRICNKDGDEFTLSASEIELSNIGSWRESISHLPFNVLDTSEPDDVLVGAAIFSVTNKWPISQIRLNSEADLIVKFDNNIEIIIKAKVDFVDWTWDFQTMNGASLVFCDSGELSTELGL